ncbi:MAG: chemotaxis protein CheW [Desulfuromonadales bacterium]|nr:chemotaxis protein CheW [Desulfuromonadales bacterium]
MPRMLLFRVGAEQYGLEIEAIQEVADDPPLYSVPQAGAFLLGAVNLHGRVLPVIDLPALLAVAAGPRDQRLVVLGPECHSLVLAVSGVGRIAAFEAADLRLPSADERLKVIAGVVEIGDQNEKVNLLDAGAVVERLEIIYAA